MFVGSYYPYAVHEMCVDSYISYSMYDGSYYPYTVHKMGFVGYYPYAAHKMCFVSYYPYALHKMYVDSLCWQLLSLCST